MYYTLEEAANILKITPGELNRMREKGALRAFRDGNTWKFRKEDINNYLADRIKNRSDSSASLGASGEDDLLSDTDDEAVTQTADTNSFEALVSNIPISVRGGSDDAGDSDDTDGSDDVGVLDDQGTGVPGTSREIDQEIDEFSLDEASESGISLVDDDDIIQTSSDSGLSLGDDIVLGGSKIDLREGDDFVLGGSGSGSGMNLAGDSGISIDAGLDQVTDAGASGSSLMNDDDNIFELSDENKEDSDQPKASPISLSKSKPEEVEELQLADEEPVELGLAEPVSTEKAPQEDFQLESSTPEDESESESSSQIIPVEDEDELFTTNDDEDSDGGVYGVAGEKTQEEESIFDTASQQPGGDSGLGAAGLGATGLGGEQGQSFDTGDFTDNAFENSDTNTGFGEPGLGGSDFGGSSFDGSDSAAGAAAGAAAGSFGDFGGLSPDGVAPTAASNTGADMFNELAATGTPVVEAEYTTLSVWLGLIPCLLLLCLAGIGVYELIRTMWSWSQPFALTGSVLETVGNLLKLT